MKKISAAIITLNEEKHIERCLHSLKGIADEIVVIDSYSKDKTYEICQRYDVKFIKRRFEGHIEQKNFAVSQAKYDIILSLDADEALSDTLKNSIIKAKENWLADAYAMNRLSKYCGKWIRHCGWYPDIKIRLFDRKKAKWAGKNPHDKIILSEGSRRKHLRGDLLHYSYSSIGEHILQMNKFTDIMASQDHLKRKHKRKIIWLYIFLYPILVFFKTYFFRLGILDGYYGFLISIHTAYYRFLKYIKLRELFKQARPSSS